MKVSLPLQLKPIEHHCKTCYSQDVRMMNDMDREGSFYFVCQKCGRTTQYKLVEVVNNGVEE